MILRLLGANKGLIQIHNYIFRNTRFWTRGIRVFCLALCIVLASCESNEKRKPNILICVADDHSFEHTSFNGSNYVNTPAFDEVARSGVFFKHAFASTPSCAPSRASILTGKPFYLTGNASMNHGYWSQEEDAPYTSLLQEAGYHMGYTGKSWSPGNYLRTDMPDAAGKEYNEAQIAEKNESLSTSDYYRNFERFLADKQDGQPFHFWFGPEEPHRPIEYGVGQKNGKKLKDVRVPKYYPDEEPVRNDLLDYAYEIEYYDRQLGKMIQKLKEIGELENTIIIVTSDHGMPFPRAKTSCYDAGMHVPLAIMWPEAIKPNRIVDDFVHLYDLAPTLLALAGKEPPETMLGKSLKEILESSESGQIEPSRDHITGGLERHGGVRTGGPDYPIRTYRTEDYLFIKNYAPDHPPAGYHPSVTWPRDDTVGGYGYVDGSPTKSAIYFKRDVYPDQFQLCLEKRPEYELYDIAVDPDQVKNLAYEENMADLVKDVESKMEAELRLNGDPRLNDDPDYFERVRARIVDRLE